MYPYGCPVFFVKLKDILQVLIFLSQYYTLPLFSTYLHFLFHTPNISWIVFVKTTLITVFLLDMSKWKNEWILIRIECIIKFLLWYFKHYSLFWTSISLINSNMKISHLYSLFCQLVVFFQKHSCKLLPPTCY